MKKVKAILYKKQFPSYDLFPEMVKRAIKNPHTLFLDGGRNQFKSSRYSFLAVNPFMIFKCRGNSISMVEGGEERSFVEDPFKCLNDLVNRYEIDGNKETTPFIGGAAGYIGYDMGRLIEEIPVMVSDDIDIPDAVLCFYSSVIIADHLKKELYAAASGLPETDSILQERKALQDLDVLMGFADFKITTKGKEVLNASDPFCSIESNFNRDDYILAVNRIKEYIGSGDVYQVNLSQRFICDTPTSPFDVYASLSEASPAPFSCFFNCDDFHILSSSPEAFLEMNKRQVETRPIKGTRPRGETEADDQKLKEDLLKSVKDRAELLMITDLERNDLGRVCKYGSIYPKALFELETYSNVFHLVSTIRGELKDENTHVDCLKECFPGGSITGAPKIRAMEIIEELERCRRKIYTGSVGYFGFNQRSDFNIVIRTILHKNGRYYFNVGGGIVADSDPEMEYEETLHKAKGMIAALRGSLNT
jgi:para-aminobenzoate synthetase component 1